MTQLRPVPDEAPATQTQAEAVAATPPEPAEPRVKSGTKEAIETLMRGRDTVPDTPPRPTRNKKKASVPSWDEILIGSRKPD